MRNLRQATLLAGAGVLFLAPLVFAQANDAEFKCEQNVDKAGAKFVAAKSKCISKCAVNAWKAIGTFADCFPPYGGNTALCISDTVLGLKGAEDKFRASIQKNCDPGFKAGTDCPDCYNSGDCSTSGYATDQVANIEGQVDSFVPGVLCETTGADALEQKCQNTTAKALVKQVSGVIKAYDKCFKNARLGVAGFTASAQCLSGGTCCPPASEPTTAAAIAKVDTKAILTIDKACGPECFGGNSTCGSNTGTCSNDALVQCGCDGDCGDQSAAADCSAADDYPTGSAWVNLVDIAISGNIPNNYCEAP
jgi:hypothetical protein